jgi:hypothetical protein
LFLILFCTSASAQINVTVSVDMTGVTVDPSGVHLVGGFNGWDPTATPMTETAPGSNVYEAVVNRPADDNIEYKVLNGNFYDRGPNGEGEEPTSPCSYLHNGNRVFTVPMADAALPTFAFGGCPPGVGRTPVTFSVDAAGLDVSQGVFVVGDMVGFNNDGFTAMSQVGATSVYQVTLMLPADLLRVNFKYATEANFGAAETTVPAPCANPDNSDRFYRFTGGTEATEVYFFNTCDVSLALPVELTRFAAAQAGKTALIQWGTAVEDAVSHFRVERSGTGTDFSLIQEVSARSDSRTNNAYEVTDTQPLSGSNYYRLTTVDLDGTRHIEGVRLVNFSGGTEQPLLLFPNPVNNQLTITFRGAGTVSVVDALGRPVHQAVATDGFNWPEADRLVPGQYYLRLKTDGGVQQVPFIKQ